MSLGKKEQKAPSLDYHIDESFKVFYLYIERCKCDLCNACLLNLTMIGIGNHLAHRFGKPRDISLQIHLVVKVKPTIAVDLQQGFLRDCKNKIVDLVQRVLKVDFDLS